MLKHLLVIFILSYAAYSFGQNLNRRRAVIVKVINEELKEVARLSKQYRHRNPRLLLRIAELYLEKARLIRDFENNKFLELPPDIRVKTDKNKFFKDSNKYFKRAQTTCERIIKRYPKFKFKSDVYYILAFNAKEFNNVKKAKRYLQLALKHARRGSRSYKKASLALAEIYYNEKNFNKAEPLYERGTLGRKDKWWTKDSFNLAWSYYRQRKYNDAIKLMLEVHEKSKSSNYVDMRSQVERDIGLFYIEANKFEEGVAFYNKLGKDISPYLVNIGKVLIDKGRPVEAERALTQSKRYLKGSQLIDVNLTLLGLYEKFGKFDKHLGLAKEITAGLKGKQVDSAVVDVLLFQLKKVGGTIQAQVLSTAYVKNPEIRKQKAQQAADYFDLITAYSSKEKGKYLFLKGETLFAAGLMHEAYDAYKVSFAYEKSQRNKAGMKNASEGMLAALGDRRYNRKSKASDLNSAYIAFLQLDKTSPKAQEIYKKLFQNYFENKKIVGSEKVLESYKKTFPKDLATQEAMLGKIMEFHRQAGNIPAFQGWVGKIKSGEYKVSTQYGKKLSSYLLSLQFKEVEAATKKGDKKGALEGYIKIYNAENSSAEAKRNAAHNLAILFFELGYPEQTFKWATIAVNEMPVKDLLKFEKSYLAISSELFNMQRFKSSSDLSSRIFKKLCKTRHRLKTAFYKNSYLVALSDNLFAEANEIVNMAAQCRVPTGEIAESQLEILEVLGEQKRWPSYEAYLEKLIRGNFSRDLISAVAKLRDSYKSLGDNSQVANLNSQIKQLYTQQRSRKIKTGVQSLWEVAQLELVNFERSIEKFHQINLEFPEEKFNKLLESKLGLLTQIANQADRIFSIRSGAGTIRTYQLLIETYQRFVKELRDFTPPGKDPNYVKGFKNAMAQVEKPLLQKSLNYLSEARKIISQGNVLSQDNYWFVPKSRLSLNIEYHFQGNGVLMDRGGKR